MSLKKTWGKGEYYGTFLNEILPQKALQSYVFVK
jgi:hypothetical protein